MDGKKLSSLVRSYMRLYRHSDKDWLDYYRGMEDFTEVIEKAALALGPCNKRHSHQRRLSCWVLRAVADHLIVKKAQLKACEDFDSLMRIVEESRVKGFGELAIYDTAHRIGLNLGITPDKVYLHRGTRVGARNLGFDGSRKYILMKELPNPLRELEPYEVEDFLCIFKDNLKPSKLKISR
jgi:hypothetical protein